MKRKTGAKKRPRRSNPSSAMKAIEQIGLAVVGGVIGAAVVGAVATARANTPSTTTSTASQGASSGLLETAIALGGGALAMKVSPALGLGFAAAGSAMGLADIYYGLKTPAGTTTQPSQPGQTQPGSAQPAQFGPSTAQMFGGGGSAVPLSGSIDAGAVRANMRAAAAGRV